MKYNRLISCDSTDAFRKVFSAFTTILQKDFRSFLHKVFITLHPQQEFLNNWHLDLISEHLKGIENGQIHRLLINLPPRSLKSICINVAWPAWLLGQNSTNKIISVSYSNVLSSRHFHNLRTILNSSWYKKSFPLTKIIKNTKSFIQSGAQGFCLSTSVQGTLTGEGGDYIIVDDPHKATDGIIQRHKTIDWFQETLMSRLNRSNGAVVVMQRLHSQDLSGFLLSDKKWTHLKLPSVSEKDEKLIFGNFSYMRKKTEPLHKERLSFNDLAKIKHSIGPYAFAAQYQQNPEINKRASIIKHDWFDYYDENEIQGILFNKCSFEKNIKVSTTEKNNIEKYDKSINEKIIKSNVHIYQSWDCAIKTNGDYTVCTTWILQQNKFYLLDIFREKLEYPDLRSAVIRMANSFMVDTILIEDKASGQQLLQELNNISNEGEQIQNFSSNIISSNTIDNTSYNIKKHRFIPIQPKYDKVTRLTISSPIFAAKRILLPKKHLLSEWLQNFINEISSFPYCKHDDQVDSVTQFLLWIEQKQRACSLPTIKVL